MFAAHYVRWLSLLLSALVLATSMPARAQLVGGLPGAGPIQSTLPPVRRRLPPAVREVVSETVPEAVTDAAGDVASRVRTPEIERLLRRHRDVLDTDHAGAPVVRNQVVAIDPTDAALARALGAGFRIGDARTLDPLGLRIVVLHGPEGVGTRSALARLRTLDPSGSYDFNHLYFGSGGAASGSGQAPDAPSTATASARVGLIDSGVARDHPALAGVDVRSWGCDGTPVPAAHGSAVASLLVGANDGPAPSGTTLFAADIYCGRPTGGAVTGYAEAMAWLARHGVGVINLSLVGPPNALLQRATAALVSRGHVLVAAVGNDGPAAPPLFPAAYPGVIGVTGVDPRKRALPEAVRGTQVDFAAPGSNLRAARLDGGWDTVRGTSFAAPLVARAAAAQVREPGDGRAARVRAQLAERALDLGDQGRDDTYGLGWLAPAASIASAGPD
ncbi:S8 family serine peptidase [Novilysobacter erysipheiresistens]|uniref:S8 family serine peptidase n=1 Tax=Novilysobacter erysipheiresistens TaxID=1749332 RepID=A0ABU7YWT6_9GAMM